MHVVKPNNKYFTQSFYFYWYWYVISIFQLILNDFGNILTLAEVCGNHRVSLAKALLNLFRHEEQVKVLLKNINDYYIGKEGNTAILLFLLALLGSFILIAKFRIISFITVVASNLESDVQFVHFRMLCLLLRRLMILLKLWMKWNCKSTFFFFHIEQMKFSCFI